MENLTTNFYEITIKDELAVLFFKNDVFGLLSNRAQCDLLFETLNNLQHDHKIKALLFLNDPECYGEKVYDSFLGKLMYTETKSKDSETSNFDIRKLSTRENIIINRFVKYISNYKKLCFTVLSGDIVTPFFGLSLATDIRYATSDTYFSLAHNKYGLHPSGGLPYFLVNQLGYSKAIELIFSEKISSKEALKLGLIAKILPKENYLDLVVEDIKKITKYNNSVLISTKRLSSYVRNSLSDYLEFEEV
ncbi:MAG: enoyl-CoA hydratase/isomerase family protein [Lutibacter sp.]|nr:enoyl-CoA hydratase/isomerase family protein [Lutibacter sp.]